MGYVEKGRHWLPYNALHMRYLSAARLHIGQALPIWDSIGQSRIIGLTLVPGLVPVMLYLN